MEPTTTNPVPWVHSCEPLHEETILWRVGSGKMETGKPFEWNPQPQTLAARLQFGCIFAMLAPVFELGSQPFEWNPQPQTLAARLYLEWSQSLCVFAVLSGTLHF